MWHEEQREKQTDLASTPAPTKQLRYLTRGEKLVTSYIVSSIILFASFTVPQIVTQLPTVQQAQIIPVQQYVDGELTSSLPAPKQEQIWTWVLEERYEVENYLVETYREVEQWLDSTGQIQTEKPTENRLYLRYWLHNTMPSLDVKPEI